MTDTPGRTVRLTTEKAVEIIDRLFEIIAVTGVDGDPFDSDPCPTIDGYLSDEQAAIYHYMKAAVLEGRMGRAAGVSS